MLRRAILMCALATVALTACSGVWSVDYRAIDPAVSAKWRVRAVVVTVPGTLTVSEANTLAPNADIVWHGDLPGDRREQVRAILDEGITRGASGLKGARSVDVEVKLLQFHAVTPLAISRAPSAVHNIKYVIQIRDAVTGAPLTDPETVAADLEAYVGAAAITAAIEGQTQRVRIVTHLAAVTRGWLGIGPDQRRTFSTLGR